MHNMMEKALRGLLIFWTVFIAVGAIAGALMMFYDTTGSALGMAQMLSFFQVLPFAGVLFQNFLIPGISLLLINGITNIVALILLISRNRYGSIAGMCCGIILMLWICIQFYIFPLNFMSTIFFIFGICEALTGYFLFRKESKQTNR